MNYKAYREYAVWDLLYETNIRRCYATIKQLIHLILLIWDEPEPQQIAVDRCYKAVAEKLNMSHQTIDANIRNLIKSLWRPENRDNILKITPDLTVKPNPKQFVLILLSELKHRYPEL